MEELTGAGTPPCDEKARLLRALTVADSDYGRAVAVLHEMLGIMRKADYQRLTRFSEEARRKSEQARVELDRHVSEHGC
jgi:hypothetical protein